MVGQIKQKTALNPRVYHNLNYLPKQAEALMVKSHQTPLNSTEFY